MNKAALDNIIRCFNLLYKPYKGLTEERRSRIEAALSDEQSLRAVCSIPIDETFNIELKKLLEPIKLKTSYCGIRYDAVFPTSPYKTDAKGNRETNLLNGSNPSTLFRLKQIMKYEAIALWQELEGLDEQYVGSFITLLGYKFMKRVNNSITYNTEDSVIYSPILLENIVSIADEVTEEIKNKDYSIYDLCGNKKLLKERYVYDKEKKFSKEQLEAMLSKYDHKPTIKELVNDYNASVEAQTYAGDENKYEIINYITENPMSPERLRWYLNQFDLIDRISQVRRRTKEEILQDKKMKKSC